VSSDADETASEQPPNRCPDCGAPTERQFNLGELEWAWNCSDCAAGDCRWQIPGEEPHVTDHAAARWDQRTSPDSVAPETAWKAGQRVSGPEIPTGTDECRVHQATRTVLLRAGGSIVTVLSERELDEDVQRDVAPLLEADPA